MKMSFREKVIKAGGAFLSILTLTGCSNIEKNEDIYERIKKQTEVFSQNTGRLQKDSWSYITQGIYRAAYSSKKGVPYVCIISIFIGLLIRHLVQEDQAIRKKAWIFIIGIPALSVAFTYGLALLIETFL